MDKIVWISFGIAILGTAIAILAIILQLLDKARLKVVQIYPGMSGARMPGADQWLHSVNSIAVIIRNLGTRPAIDCEAIVLFPHLEPLPLHPETRDHTINTGTTFFTVQPKAQVQLVGAWNITPNGTIDGMKVVMTPGEFLEKATPLSILISHGTKRLRAQLTKDQAQRLLEKHQVQSYLNEVH